MNTEIEFDKKINILLVEDDIVDRETIKRNLNQTNLIYHLTEVDSVKEGIKLIQKGQFDVIFLDYHLPNKNGAELLKFFRKNMCSQNAAIIMISLNEDLDIIFECFNLGAQDFISKNNITPIGLKRAIINAQIKSQLENELTESNLKLKTIAEYDALTGIHNRYYLNQQIEDYFNSNDTKREFSLILLNINKFKSINDLYGHKIGDQLLIEFTEIIKKILPNDVVFSRIGGDEFAVFLDSRLYNAQLACQAIHQALTNHITVDDVHLTIAVSIGYASTPSDTNNITKLFQFADLALHYSKNSTNSIFYGFASSMYKAFKDRVAFKQLMKQAYVDKGFSINYQPIVNSTDSALVGFEALMRLKINGEYIPPGKFIKILEQMSLIHDLGYWLIDEVLKQHAAWLKQSKKQFKISINLSPVQLKHEKIIVFIIEKITEYKIPPQLVMFEITETVFLDNPERIKLILKKLSTMGCKIALDDFGTGFSSLSHLKSFPIDTVKIDRSLLPVNKADIKTFNILKGVATMIDILGLETIAEGIESNLHLNYCQQLNIQCLQGYYFSKPLNPADIEKKYFNWKGKFLKKLSI